MAIALNTVIFDGQEYKPGDVIPDFKSIKCVDTREPRKYQGLSADVSVLNDVIAKYASGGASCFMSDTGEYYEYDRKEKTWKLITNITERGFGSEKAYGALKHMLKNVTVSDEKIQSAVTDYLTVNPVLPGATTEQAQQIEQNKTDVASLKEETDSLKEDLGDLATFGKNQYIDSKTAKDNTLWRNLSGNITRSDGYSGFTTFPMISLAKGTYFISKKIWHKYTWVKNINGKIVALNTIDGIDGDTYSGVISFSEDVELYITIQTANLPLMVADGDEEPPYYIDFGKYGKSLNGNYKVDAYTLSEIEKSAIRDYTKIDYHFVKNGKLVCNNSNPTSSGAVAKYTKADMGSNIVKAMCLFSARNGGNVTLISTPLDTDNNVQNIVNKSIHCIFGMSSCVAQTFLNGTAKTLGTITYPTLNNDDTTEYECGFEIINNNTLRLYAPNGKTLDCTGDWSEYNGNFFIYEEYNGKPNIGDTTSEWERPSIIAVFCKPTNGHCLRDEFKNYPSGYIPCVAPSGHVYTNFRNVAADDNKYVNANGTHDN